MPTPHQLEPNFHGGYYDLLSGRFRPTTDQLNREHTLARLSRATVLYGDPAQFGKEFTYQPSWAPDTLAIVSLARGMARRVSGLEVVSTVDSNIGLRIRPVGREEVEVTNGFSDQPAPETERIYSLSAPAAEMDEQQADLATRAQMFYADIALQALAER